MKKSLLFVLGLFTLVSCNPSEPPTPPVHQHTYSSTYSYDENRHWKQATCEHSYLKTEENEHTFGPDNKCSVCSYQREISTVEVPLANRIANVNAMEQTFSNIYGVVISTNGEGSVISDGFDAVYIYGHTETELTVGDYISISGKYTSYNGIKEFAKETTWTKLDGPAPEITIPSKTLTNEELTKLWTSKSILLPLAKYNWNAQVTTSGNYKVFNVEGCTTPIEAPKTNATVDADLVLGNYYDLTGIYYGTSTLSGGYHCFMLLNHSKTADGQLEVHTCEHVCKICGLCKDKTCTDPVCSKKCTCIEVSEEALVIDFTVGDETAFDICVKADATLEEKTFTYNSIKYGYIGCCRNVTDYGKYFFMLGKEKKAQTTLYNLTAFDKDIKSITVVPTSSASSKVVWTVSLSTTVMNAVTIGTDTMTGKSQLTVTAPSAGYKYFNISTTDAANNLQVAKIIIEFN